MVDHPHATTVRRRRPEPMIGDDPLDDFDRMLIGGSVRIDIQFQDRYQLRRDLEMLAGACTRAIAATHRAHEKERSVLMDAKATLSVARMQMSTTKVGRPRKNALSPGPR
jgi:hypothetical protein